MTPPNPSPVKSVTRVPGVERDGATVSGGSKRSSGSEPAVARPEGPDDSEPRLVEILTRRSFATVECVDCRPNVAVLVFAASTFENETYGNWLMASTNSPLELPTLKRPNRR